MKLNDRKKAVILYILEKIEQNSDSISKVVSENFDINQNTVHKYINELSDEGIIRRIKRGKYELINNKTEYSLKRNKGDLDSDTRALDNYIEKYLEDMPENVKAIWRYTFSEMINNVMDHSEASDVKLVIEQNYLKTKIEIWDNGVGAFEKIKNYFGLPSLDDAVGELFKGKLTTDAANHSGEGIFFSSRIMDDFLILSGNKLFTHNKYDDNYVYELLGRKFKGTCVVMSLSDFSQKKLKDVFDSYSNDNGKFTKTDIILKNMFDTIPISRSQAKRVCNRLENFSEVIIDFDNIEWMGQGFAHQIFVVYANEHPELKLIPINMNEDVTKMYNHVID